MAWHPKDIVADAVNTYLNYYIHGGSEDIIFSRPATVFEPTSRSTAIDHDASMINKVSRLHEDNPDLPRITAILQSLKDAHYHALLAKYRYVGLYEQSGKAYKDEDRAKLVGQEYTAYRKNLQRGKKAVFSQLTTACTLSQKVA